MLNNCFSKFIRPDSIVLKTSIENFSGAETDPLEAVAAETPDKKIVLVILNRHSKNVYNLAVTTGKENTNNNNDKNVLNIDVKPNSIKTVVWKQ